MLNRRARRARPTIYLTSRSTHLRRKTWLRIWRCGIWLVRFGGAAAAVVDVAGGEPGIAKLPADVAGDGELREVVVAHGFLAARFSY